jgi:hypothetical protein
MAANRLERRINEKGQAAAEEVGGAVLPSHADGMTG